MQAHHPFLVGMKYVFQTEQRIYFVMRYVKGGELYRQMRASKRFDEEHAKFYVV